MIDRLPLAERLRLKRISMLRGRIVKEEMKRGQSERRIAEAKEKLCQLQKS